MMDLLVQKQPDTIDIVGMRYSHIMLAVLDNLYNIQLVTSDSRNVGMPYPCT
jgi:hypothetical protein